MENPFTQFNQRMIPLLNKLWNKVKSIETLTGDDFINVRRFSGGTSLKLNINAVRRRIPKVTSGGGNGTPGTQVKRAVVTQDAPSGNVITANLLDSTTGLIPINLDYDGQTTDFTIGATLTGGTSGATGTISADQDDGASGTLILSSITGTFSDNETITGSSGGSATADGTQYEADPVDVYFNISGGSDLNEALPRLAEDDEIFVVESVFDNSGTPVTRWYCVSNFQTTEDCVCEEPA